MNNIFGKKLYIILGVISAAALIAYGLSYIIMMPELSPGGFVPGTVPCDSDAFSFGMLLAVIILVYAFAFLPVTILFTIKKYKTNPYAMILACSLLCVSLLLEIINNLPLLAKGIYTGNLVNISPDVLLYFQQSETIRYLSFDVAGFTLFYAAVFIYALIFFKTYKFFSYAIFLSIAFFIANIPFLWLSSRTAVTLMALSIFALSTVPVFQAYHATRDNI